MSTSSAPDRESQTIILRDGRRLGFAEYGDPSGKPVFHFHGYPGSRFEGRIARLISGFSGVRMIAVDRPGMGISDFQPHRKMTDWPDDVAQLADALHLDRFVVEGVSGGGPYSLVCAYKMPDRVVAAVVVAGVGPLDSADATRGMKRSNRVLFRLGKASPWLLRIPMWQMGRAMRKDPIGALKKSAAELPAPDRELLNVPKFLEVFAAESAEAFRQGISGPSWEGAIYVRPWGFPLKDIRVPTFFWQGDQDVNVPAEMARWQASQVPNAVLHMIPGEAHVSLAYHYLDKIIAEALTVWPAGA
jgi:pimeloyl-ACP methyl ester carboxylesterase